MNLDLRKKMIAVTAPSGAGKSTIVRHLLKHFKLLDFSVSATTREMRPKEIDGKDYYFLGVDKFRKLIEEDAFVEYEEVYEDQLYGTLKSEVERIWAEGKFVVFDIDVKGAQSIKKLYGDSCLAIFIKPPSLAVLIERLKNRRTESEKSLRKRIARVKKEMTYEQKFDMVLLNDDLQVALTEAEFMVTDYLGINEEE